MRWLWCDWLSLAVVFVVMEIFFTSLPVLAAAPLAWPGLTGGWLCPPSASVWPDCSEQETADSCVLFCNIVIIRQIIRHQSYQSDNIHSKSNFTLLLILRLNNNKLQSRQECSNSFLVIFTFFLESVRVTIDNFAL